MHKSAHLRDITTQWLEKRKNCVPDTRVSNLSTPAYHRQFTGGGGGGGGSTVMASSSSMVTVTRLTPATSRASAASRAAAAKNKRNGMKPHRRLPPPLYVKLAEDSASAFSEQYDSDSSSLYNSFNEVETDTAKDESDYSDGYVTDGFATMDVFEYEVDDLSDSEDLESHGSSSGTDDMVDVVAHALFDSTSSSSDSDNFEIFAQDADTEESDGPTDPELGRADYWTCIKCKNQKNNPMYRFCEKCYQIRKTHFPPRPKHRRKRSSLAQRGNSKLAFSSPSTSSTISMQDEKRDRHLEDDDDDDNDINGRISRNSSCDGSENIGKQFLCNKLQAQRRRTLSSSYKQQQQQQQQQKTHSAGESSCCSSQELSPDEQQPSTLSSQAAYLVATAAACASSQETYCSDIEQDHHQHNHRSIVSSKQSNSLFEHNYPNSQESVYPNSECTLSKFDSLVSTASACSVSGSSQSSNECESNGTMTETTSGVFSQAKTSDSDSDTMAKLKSSQSLDINVTTTTKTTTTTPSTAASVEKTPSSTSVATINRSASEARVSSSRKLKKRKIDFTDEISDAEVNDDELMAKKFRAMEEADTSNGMCMICLTEPKNGAFVHNRFLHVCCCYRCTVKVWNKRKRCPICNSQVKTVLKMFVH